MSEQIQYITLEMEPLQNNQMEIQELCSIWKPTSLIYLI